MQKQVVDHVLDCVKLRRLHNERMAEMEAASVQGQEGDGARRRHDYWAWFRVDEPAFTWCHRGIAKGPWPYLAPVWSPFEEFNRADRPAVEAALWEPRAMGIGPAAMDGATWKDDASSAFALAHLVDLVQVKKGDTWDVALLSQAAQDFEALQQAMPEEFRGKANPSACAAAIDQWTGLRTWLPLVDPRKRQPVGAVGAYEVQAIRCEDADPVRRKLSGLARQALDLCCWREKPSAAWLARYQAKAALAELADPLLDGPARDPWSPGLGALSHLACWSEPRMSPFEAKPAKDSILLTTSPKGLSPASIRGLPPAERAARLKRMESWCLVPMSVDSEGRVRPIQAGYMGFVDLLQEPRAPAASTQEAPK